MLYNFDIEKFCPRIKYEPLKNAIKFAENYIGILDNDSKIIEHTCMSILTYDNKTWIKKDEDTLFDVPMASFFGAELCDLIELFILNHLHPHMIEMKSVYIGR